MSGRNGSQVEPTIFKGKFMRGKRPSCRTSRYERKDKSFTSKNTNVPISYLPIAKFWSTKHAAYLFTSQGGVGLFRLQIPLKQLRAAYRVQIYHVCGEKKQVLVSSIFNVDYLKL